MANQQQQSKPRSLNDRVTILEQTTVQVVTDYENRLKGIGTKLAEHQEILDALCELAGKEQVAQLVNQNRIARARAQAAQEEMSLKAGITAGYVVPGEVIGEKSILIGRFVKPDGTVEEPGRAQFVVPGLTGEVKASVIGQKAGYELAIPSGDKFVVDEVYELDQEKAKEYVQAQQKAAAEEAAKAAAQASAASQDDGQDELSKAAKEEVDPDPDLLKPALDNAEAQQ